VQSWFPVAPRQVIEEEEEVKKGAMDRHRCGSEELDEVLTRLESNLEFRGKHLTHVEPA